MQGAINRVPPEATAFARRNLLFNGQYYIDWTDSSQQSDALAWINGLQSDLSAVMPSSTYLNYIDKDVPDWPSSYYGAALPRLVTIKAKYDPMKFFSFNQSIPASAQARRL